MKNDLIKRVTAVLISISFIFVSVNSTVYASYNQNKLVNNDLDYEVSYINNNNLIVNSKNSDERIMVKEDEKVRNITIYNNDTGEENHLILNKDDGTIYSSITNKTIDIDSNNRSVLYSSPIVSSRNKTVYISWAEIREAVGETATVGGVIGLLLVKIPGTQVIGGSIGTISTIIGGGSLIIPKDSQHGIKFEVEIIKYYRRNRVGNGKTLRTLKQVTSVSRY